LQAIGRGADIVIHQADVAAQGVFDACRDQNIFAIGSNVDQNNNSSGIVIASAIVRGESFFLNVARRVKQGTFKGNEKLVVGMKEGAVDFVINPHFESLISKETEELLEKTKKDILEGKLTVPKDEF
jgi:basic membrane lipoprotein Med (substrate-binding protein (PBP1-ABC) superfamily)